MQTDVSQEEYRVLLLAATRRDAEVTKALLDQVHLGCVVCKDARDAARQLEIAAGCLLLTDAAFHDPHMDALLEALRRQPGWSDLPSVLLCRSGPRSRMADHALQAMPNVTLLERPTSTRTLVSSVQAALRARRRQYQIREQFCALQESEAALQAASNALAEANRRKDEFLAMLAHELRNPLAPICNASEVLARKLSADEQMQDTVNIVRRQARHLGRLVDDLLDVSRITEGRIELRVELLELSTILAQAVESVEPLVREKSHKLLVSAHCGRLYVKGDPARLVQCVSNTLTNAAKYTDCGGEIRLEVQQREHKVALVISDNGVGIPNELLPRVFDLFVQGDRSLDRSQGGLGIGLSVVKRLIEMHGGEVTARSDGLGRGSTFELQLPLADPPHGMAPEPAAASGSSKRILVVDDNADAADSLAALLELDGHETVTVYSAHEAVARAGELKPDVVLLDIGLPDMNGYEVATHIRSSLDSVQLIAVTGYGQAEDIQRAHSVGFDAHLVKPIDVERLESIMQAFDSGAE